MSSNGNGNNMPAVIKGDLGQMGVVARMGRDGMIQAVKATVVLDKALDHLYEIPIWAEDETGKKSKSFKTAITAMGYNRLNAAAGIQVVKPAFTILDNRRVHNPYIERDPTGNIVSVLCRAIAIGRAPTGNLVAVDQTLYWSPRAYFINELLRKSRYAKGLLTVKPSACVTQTERDTMWLIDQGMGLMLVVNTGHEEFFKKFVDYQELLKFGERRAQTIVERNALKKHPAIATATVRPDEKGRVRVEVFSYREADRTSEEMIQLAMHLAETGSAQNVDVIEDRTAHEDDEPLEIETGELKAIPEVTGEAPDTEPEPEEKKVELKARKPTKATGPLPSHRPALSPEARQQLIGYIETAPVGDGVLGRLQEAAGLRPGALLADATDEQLEAVKVAITKAVDAQQ